MLHDLISHSYVVFDTVAAGESGTSDSFKTAIVVTAGTVISAGFGALAIVIPKRRDNAAAPPTSTPPVETPPDLQDNPFVKFLLKQNEDMTRHIFDQDAQLERLKSFCWNNNLDPIRLRRMRLGERHENPNTPD